MFIQEFSSCDSHVTTIQKCLLLTSLKYNCFLKTLPENEDTGHLYNNFTTVMRGIVCLICSQSIFVNNVDYLSIIFYQLH